MRERKGRRSSDATEEGRGRQAWGEVEKVVSKTFFKIASESRRDQKESDALERPSLLLGGAVPGCEATGIKGD